MASGSAGDSGRGWRGKGEWILPAAVLAIAFLTAFVVERLYESALRSHDVQILLVQIEEEVNEQQLGEYEAVVEGEVTPEAAEQIAESRADLARSLTALEALTSGEQPERIRELLLASEAAIDEELRLIEQGRIDEARALDEGVVDPTFEELRDVLESADAEYGAYGGRVVLVADVGGFAVAGLAILLTAWFVRRDRNRRAEQRALEESEERFRSLVQEGADLILILDAAGTVRYAAPSVDRVLGHAAGAVVGRDVFELLIPGGGARQEIAGVLREPGAKTTTELAARRADGSGALFEATFSNMTATPGVGGIVMNGRDVTERREAEETLRDSEERYRVLYEDNPSMYFTLDEGGTVLSVNRFGAGQLGYEPDELIGRPVLDIFCDEDREAAAEHVADCLRNPGRISQWEIRKVRKDGSVMWVRENARAVPDPDGRTVVLVNCEDVTERKEAEALLLRQGAAMETAANGIAILDADGTFTYANDAHARVYGYDGAAALVGRKTWRNLYDEDELSRFDEHVMPAIGRQGHWRGEAVGKRRDGSSFPQELSVSLLEGGGFVCIVQDVTKRKEAEAEIRRLNEELEGRVRERTAQLRASEARLRALFAAMTDVILVLDAEGRYLEIAPTNPSLLYRPPEETIGRTLHELFPKEQADAFAERIRAALRTRQTVRVEYSLPIGDQEVWFDGTVSPMQEDKVLFVARDVTERRRAEEAVRRSEERHRALVDTAPDAIITMTTDGLIRSFNSGAERIFGYGAEEAVGQPLRLLMPERYREPHERGVRRHVKTGERRIVGRGAIELTGLRKGGEKFPLELSLASMGEGDDALFTGILRDVTDRKRAEEELKSYARKLARSNRELQDFAYVASHDLQEPLRKVRTFGDRLRTKYAAVLDGRALDYLDRMEGATARMQALIDDLLVLSRVTTRARPFAPVDLGGVAREVLSDLEARIEQAGGRVEVGELPVVEADRMQMRQLFQNLVSNALKFHRPGEPPLVRVRGSLVDERDERGAALCRLVVEDEGIGFEEEHAERIFAPFERLHGRGSYEGTGMGLAICRKVVERHGGKITATGNPERGAAFVVTLPVEHHDVEEIPAKGDGVHDYAALGR
ncbi:PAS domain S-box protein [Rubrobacter marinus]|uniref:histidine kinase n=1 Tax=Rubrobacter marinus TaxID=2653852 RepID=A0A6G8PZK1_9ACTN|nr:PAS domain S-box protein [Rubrobacter marinus]QIN79664.1 PAS domain S-box protein [Rubrobacter marinus]